MKKTHTQPLLTLSLVCLAMTTASHAEPYYGANVGGSVITISKDVSYTGTSATLSDKYYGLRVQALLGYNFHFSQSSPGTNTSSQSYTNMSEEYADHPAATDDDGDDDENTLAYHSSGDEFYFAIELDGNYNSGEAKETIDPWFITTTASVRERQKYSLDLFALAKYKIQRNLIVFIGPGISQASFAVNTSTATAGNLGITGDTSTTVPGWSLKAGLEIPLSKMMNLVATYQYASFNSASWSRIEPLTDQTVTVKYSPVVNSVMIGLNWSL